MHDMYNEDRAYHISILKHFLGQIFNSDMINLEDLTEKIYSQNGKFPPKSRYAVEQLKRYEVKGTGGEEANFDLPAREIAHQAIEMIGGTNLVDDIGFDIRRLGDLTEERVNLSLAVAGRKTASSASDEVRSRAYMQRRSKTKTVRQVFSMPPELVEATKLAAKANGVSASLLVSQILQKDDLVAEHLKSN